MKIGVAMSLTDTCVDVATLARKAEELGFESLWLPEHVAIPVNTTSPTAGWRPVHAQPPFPHG